MISIKEVNVFYDSFKKYCDSIGKSPTTVAKEIGFTANAPTAWKIKGSTPKSSSVQKIADYFGISTDELLNGDPKPTKLHREPGEKVAVSLMCRSSRLLSAREIISRFIRAHPPSSDVFSVFP